MRQCQSLYRKYYSKLIIFVVYVNLEEYEEVFVEEIVVLANSEILCQKNITMVIMFAVYVLNDACIIFNVLFHFFCKS